MTPDGTIGGNLGWAFWFLGEIAFKWVPGTVAAVTGTNPAVATAAPPAAIDAPVTAPDMVQYLQTAASPEAYAILFHRWSVFVAFSLIFSLCMFALVIYCSVRVWQIRQIEKRRFAAAQRTVAAKDVPKTQLRWNRVLEQANSEHEQTRRLAILEADIMLNELLDLLGYKGETMADKMRQVNRSNFQTIDKAWEAHRFRNKIVHESGGEALSAREVRRVIALYESVFREFRFIE